MKISYRKNSVMQIIRNFFIKNRIYPYTNQRTFESTVNGAYYSGKIGNLIDRHVALYGCYEKHVCEFLRSVAMLNGGPERCVFVDIGANKGHHSLFLSSHVKEIQAFEPYQPIADEFSDLMSKGQIQNITLNRVGLSDCSEELTFFPPNEENQGVGSFDDNNSNGFANVIRLKVCCGDEFLKGKQIHLVKIDVEGFEKRVLGGLAQTLSDNRPVVCFEEKSGHVFPTQEYLAIFPDNYVFYAFEQRDRSEIKRQRADGIWTLALVEEEPLPADDYVAIPKELFVSSPPKVFGPLDFERIFRLAVK